MYIKGLYINTTICWMCKGYQEITTDNFDDLMHSFDDENDVRLERGNDKLTDEEVEERVKLFNEGKPCMMCPQCEGAGELEI